MRKYLLLLFIIVYVIISRFLFLDKIPPPVNSILLQRSFSASLSVGSVIIIYFLVKTHFRSQRIAFLSALIFAILPWTIEQGRIVSQPNFALFSVLFFLLLTKLFSNSSTSGESIRPPPRCLDDFAHPRGGFKSFLLYFFIPFIIYFTYPQFWLFRVKDFNLSLSNFINNLFILVSPDFLFFKNPTFWWGGVREFGVLYVTFLPFLILGIYELLIRTKYNILVWMIVILLISSLSPFFPESREFYFITPFISIIVSLGLYKFTSGESWLPLRFSLPPPRWLLLFLFLSLLIYEMAQFFHYYAVHYPKQIRSNIENIHEAF